jgi:hypothetical protein
MVTQSDAETRGVVVEDEEGPDEAPALDVVELGPEEPGHDSQGKQRRADEERRGHPFDAVDREVFELHENPSWRQGLFWRVETTNVAPAFPAD